MEKEGYDRAFTAALIACASTMANLIPPSIMAVVYGATGNVSIGGLFLAGVVPGVLVGIGLMIYSHFFGPVGIRRRRSSFGEVAGWGPAAGGGDGQSPGSGRPARGRGQGGPDAGQRRRAGGLRSATPAAR